jgi:hypothetical protein
VAFISFLILLVAPAMADEAHDRAKLLRQFDREISRFQRRITNVLHEYYNSPSANAWDAELEARRIQRENTLNQGKRPRGKDRNGVPESVIEDYFQDAGENISNYTVNRGGALADAKVAPVLKEREDLEKFLDPAVIAEIRTEFIARIDQEGATAMRNRIRSQYSGVNGCIWKKWATWTGFVVLFAGQVGLGIAMIDPTALAGTGLSWASNLFIGNSTGVYAGIMGGVIALVTAEFSLAKKTAPPVRCRFQRLNQ